MPIQNKVLDHEEHVEEHADQTKAKFHGIPDTRANKRTKIDTDPRNPLQSFVLKPIKTIWRIEKLEAGG